MHSRTTGSQSWYCCEGRKRENKVDVGGSGTSADVPDVKKLDESTGLVISGWLAVTVADKGVVGRTGDGQTVEDGRRVSMNDSGRTQSGGRFKVRRAVDVLKDSKILTGDGRRVWKE